MERNGLERLAPLTGVLFVVLLVVALVLGGEPPDADAPRGEVLDYWTDKETEAMVSSFLGALAMVPYLWFVGTLRSALRAAEGRTGRLSGIAFAGGIVFAAYALVGLTVQFVAADTAGDVPAEVTQTLSALSVESWLGLAVGNAVLLLATGVLAVRTGVFPSWLGWITVLLGIASITPAGFFAFLLTFVWILGISILLFLRDRAPAAPAPTAPASSPGSPS